MTESGDGGWREALSAYSLRKPRVLGLGSGTAAPKIIVQAGGRRYLLRRRRPRWSEPQVVSFDHSVIAAIVAAELPSVLPEQTSEGKTWAHVGDVAYELFPYVEGLCSLESGNVAQIASAGEVLARFHLATAAALPAGHKPWLREHEMRALEPTLVAAMQSPGAEGNSLEAAKEMLGSARRLQKVLTPMLVRSLPQVIIHADYTPANILFRGNVVGGIFDYDWVSEQPALIDVGEALQFFAFRRSEPIDPGSIWSLVQGWEPDVVLGRAFLDAYETVRPLTPAEKRPLPLFMRETWLGIRIRAMRKVPREQRLNILTQGALGPLRWLEQRGHTLV